MALAEITTAHLAQGIEEGLLHSAHYLGIAKLAQEIDLTERTIEAWVKTGKLPPPKVVGGKRLWKWSEVEAYLDRGGGPESDEERIINATRAAIG